MTATAEPGTGVLDTTELRWFADGPPPTDVVGWFTGDASLCAVEERTDVYRLEGGADLGVKHRSGTTLERKVRLAVEEPMALSAGLRARTEVWRKWSPAVETEVDVDPTMWVSVHKLIVKRLFTADGDEEAFSVATRAGLHAGCDVELADVSVAGRRAWTFAFAAFGPASRRRDAIVACWRALETDGPAPAQLEALTTAAGYPRWLRSAVDRQDRPSSII